MNFQIVWKDLKPKLSDLNYPAGNCNCILQWEKFCSQNNLVCRTSGSRDKIFHHEIIFETVS